MQVSHETIYVSLFVQSRGVLKKALIAHLRRRRSKRADPEQQGGGIIDAVSTRERPAEVEDRAVPGHWEGDMLSGRPQLTHRNLWLSGSRGSCSWCVCPARTPPAWSRPSRGRFVHCRTAS